MGPITGRTSAPVVVRQLIIAERPIMSAGFEILVSPLTTIITSLVGYDTMLVVSEWAPLSKPDCLKSTKAWNTLLLWPLFILLYVRHAPCEQL
jgi:hypothetical protein